MIMASNSNGGDEATSSNDKNYLGIPVAEFVVSSSKPILTRCLICFLLYLVYQEDVDEFMKRGENDMNATSVIKKLDEQHQKYRFMELNLIQKKRRLKKQIPDIKSSLDVLKLVKTKRDSSEEMVTNYLLSDHVFNDAKVAPTDKICLWLGANVMLEYSLDEADELLSKNLDTASKNLAQIDVDLDYLRDQITTTEVNMARVYNWDVKRRQMEKLQS